MIQNGYRLKKIIQKNPLIKVHSLSNRLYSIYFRAMYIVFTKANPDSVIDWGIVILNMEYSNFNINLLKKNVILKRS